MGGEKRVSGLVGNSVSFCDRFRPKKEGESGSLFRLGWRHSRTEGSRRKDGQQKKKWVLGPGTDVAKRAEKERGERNEGSHEEKKRMDVPFYTTLQTSNSLSDTGKRGMRLFI